MVDLLKSSLSAPIKRIQKHLSKAMELQAGRRSYCGRHDRIFCGSCCAWCGAARNLPGNSISVITDQMICKTGR